MEALLESLWPGSTQHLVLLSATLLLAGPALYFAGLAVYNAFLHPLRGHPGPLLWRMSHLPFDYHVYNGTFFVKVAELHKQPNELSYTDARAWNDIWAHKPGKEEWPKDPTRVQKPPNGILNILGADKENHARYRRLLAHAFSEKGLREQEDLITKYVELLVTRLGEVASRGETTDIVTWFNMTVFDVIGDLAWGKDFNCLEGNKLHDWIPAVLGSLKFVVVAAIVRQYGLDFLIPYFVPKEVQAARLKNYKYAKENVEKRAEYGAARGDFWDRVLIKSADDNKSGEGMSEGEMLNNASVLVLGGSETSATTLSGATYLLLRNPEKMRKLVEEIRTSFRSSDDITATSVARLKYTDAVLEEAMRIYPPVPMAASRRPPKGGAWACGNFIPDGTSNTMAVLAANHLSSNFHRPEEFVPERWLENRPKEFEGDNRTVQQPFSVGTRNCIGRNLAYVEMRLILAKILWHYDLELDEAKTGDWLDQKAWGLWSKPPLWVRVKEARR